MDKKPLTFPPKNAKTSPAPDVAQALTGEHCIACDCDMFFGPSGPLDLPGVTHMRFDDLTAKILSALQPGLIILPLFNGSQDAAGAVERLEELGYAGRITVLAPTLPRPGLVEHELRALGPGERLVLISP